MRSLPNSTAVLVLGILSITLFCCCYGLISTILAVIALILSAQDKKLYLANPEAYTKSSFSNLNAGRTCAIIGLVLAVIYLFSILILFIVKLSSGEFESFEIMFEKIIEQIENI